ncbi:MAG: glycerate kinase [Candidatus Aminicenantaceae bacterium]
MGSKNYFSLDLLKSAEKIYKAALAEVEPENLIKKSVLIDKEKLIVQDRSFDLGSFKNIFLVSIGKAAPFMAKSLMEIIGTRVKEGIAVCRPQVPISIEKISCLPASHPLPDEKSLKAARSILKLAEGIGENDLLFVLISGGGSAQICFPAEGISLDEKRLVTDMLLKAGANITELNTVRKHLSRIKGGRLAKAAFPGTVVSLVISDVIHNDLESIASGPVYWDSSTYYDAFQVLKKYEMWDKAPVSVQEVIKKGMEYKVEETVKKEDPVFKRVHNFIIGDNLKALRAAKNEAEKLGFKTLILTSSDQGEAKDAAKNYVSLLENLVQAKKEDSRYLCLLTGGELTVTVEGDGLGGRNQEFVLAVFAEIKNRLEGVVDWLVLSLGSDGIDGPTDAAGALVRPSTFKKARDLSLNPREYLDNNDSYNFFKQIGDLIVTGPTRTNVMDLRLFLVKK